MLIAITGATGLIGSYTVRKLKSAGHHVRALARRTSRRDHVAAYVDEWISGEFFDPQAQAGLVAGAECVLHAAVDFAAADQMPTAHFTRNVMGTLQLLEASRLANVEQFIFISSGAAYAEILPDRKLDENHPAWPDSLYGAGKASVEPFLKAYHKKFGINTSSWRPVAVYGIAPELNESRWIELVRAVKEGRTVSTADGGKIVHVEDVADALTLAVGDRDVAGRFFNLVDRHMYWQQAAEFARELTHSSSQIDERKGSGPKNNYDTSSTIAFYEKHHNHVGIRRGLDGVKQYVGELLARI